MLLDWHNWIPFLRRNWLLGVLFNAPVYIPPHILATHVHWPITLGQLLSIAAPIHPSILYLVSAALATPAAMAHRALPLPSIHSPCLRARASPSRIFAQQAPQPPAKQRKVAIFVEPSPFSHVSGMKNRFECLIKGLRDAGDDVVVFTPDRAPPKEFHGARVRLCAQTSS